VVLKDDVIRGFIAVGRIENSGVYNALIRNEIMITKIKESLLDPDFNYAKAMPLIRDYRKKFDKDEFQDSLLTY
jgi:NAD(P)H-nitrite reductase large subunit